jgi:hypothetical protein
MTVATCPEPCAMPILCVPGIMGSRPRQPGRGMGCGPAAGWCIYSHVKERWTLLCAPCF